MSGLRIKIQVVFATVALVLFFLLFLLKSTGLTSGSEDLKSVMLLLLENDGDGDAFFRIPILVYQTVGNFGVSSDLFALFWGAVLTYFSFYRDFELKNFCIGLFLFIPAPLMYMVMPSKELFLLSFMLLWINLYDRGKVLNSIFLVLFYSIIFRYYFLICFVSSLLARYLKYRIILFKLLLLILLPSLLFFHDKIFYSLSAVVSRRDISFDLHYGVIRSSFENILTPDTWVNLIINYIYAFFRLNFIVLFEFGIKELFLQIYVFLAFYVACISFVKHPILVAMFFGMFVFYPIFEPDLGSYLRHLSSWFPLLTYLLSENISKRNVSSKVFRLKFF